MATPRGFASKKRLSRPWLLAPQALPQWDFSKFPGHNCDPETDHAATEETPSASQPQQSYLHLLPGELRNQIYQDTVLYHGEDHLQLTLQPNLALAYPDLAPEINSLFFAKNRFDVVVFSDMHYRFARRHPIHPSASLKARPISRSDYGKLSLDGETYLHTHQGKTLRTNNVSYTVCNEFGSVEFKISFRYEHSGVEHEVQHTSSRLKPSRNRYKEATGRMREKAARIAHGNGGRGFTIDDLEAIASVCSEVSQ